LARLREAGVVEVASIAALGRMWGWKRERTSKALVRWEGAGCIEREDRPKGTIVIRVPGLIPADDPACNGGGPGPGDDFPAGKPTGNPQVSASDDVPPVAGEPDFVPAPDIPAGNLRVPAVPAPVKWWITWRPVGLPAVPALYRWIFGGMSVALSFALYFISTFLNMTFWANLNPDMTAKGILASGGLVIELINYTVPSAVAFVPSTQRVLRLVVWAVLCVTMVATAVAGAGVVKNSLGASQVSRKQTIEERNRLQGIIDTPLAPISDASVVAAREKRDTAKAVARSDCPKNKSLDVELCSKSKAAWVKAEADLTLASEKHDTAVTAAEQQHRKDVADSKAELDRLSVISVDLDIVAAGVNAIIPGVEEVLVTRGVVALWVLLFSLGPCALLRLGLSLLAPPRWGAPV
jgi:hypothetical protein